MPAWRLFPARESYPETFGEELDVQASRIVPAAALVCLFVWLPYVSLDKALFPNNWWMPICRLGLTAVGIGVLLARRALPAIRWSTLAAVIVGYLQWTTALITGLTGGEAVYMGGLVFVLMLSPVAPASRGFLWTSLGVAALVFFTSGLITGLDFDAPERRYSLTDLITAIGVSAFLVYVIDYIRRRSWEKSLEIERQRALLADDNARIDALLLNILPPPIATELKQSDRVQPRSYQSATVVFADFVGFTQLASQVSPEELLAELDHCFSYFDAVMDRHGLEKLKTIGDAYMFAGGIPEENATHAVDAVLAALEFQRFMAKTRETRGAFWSLRLGINTGPLIAGVVGQKKFVYDVWGDTVNTASRMESAGTPDEVNISATTRAKVGQLFDVVSRGEIPIKGKGMLEMFHVRGIRPEFSKDGAGVEPNEAFDVRYRALQQR